MIQRMDVHPDPDDALGPAQTSAPTATGACLRDPTTQIPSDLVRLLGPRGAGLLAGTDPRDPAHFLHLVTRLAGVVDTPRDRRAVARECAALLRATGRDSHRLEVAFDAGAFSAIDYLLLGEISAASRRVRSQVRSQRTVDNPFAAAPTVHLSAPRIGIYLDGCRDLLGDRVHARIAAHLAGCAACQRAVERRRHRAADSDR